MKIKLVLTIIIIAVLLNYNGNSAEPKKDKGQFIDYKNEFYQEILKSIEDFNKKETPKKLSFKVDFNGMNLPKSIKEFKTQWHNEPVSQGNTGTCWCFCGTSFLETEVKRLHNKEIKFSEMFTVYWEYVEKARRFVKERGNSAFAEGSQQNAVTRIWKQYGCVPAELYTGLKKGQKFHDHSKLIKEMENYLNKIKEMDFWNEEQILENIKSILNYHLGTPPEFVNVGNKKMTPLEYLKNEVKLNLDEYVSFMSLMEKPYYSQAEYEVTDNWWKCSEYYNVPLDEYMKIFVKALNSGYTIVIGGDVSEPGYDSHSEVAYIPTFDIPSEYIDENARQLRFTNNSTTDDHGIHIVGIKETKDGKWFVIKDSGSGARNGANKGYYFYHYDYIKLKMMNFMIHRSIVEDILKKF